MELWGLMFLVRGHQIVMGNENIDIGVVSIVSGCGGAETRDLDESVK